MSEKEFEAFRLTLVYCTIVVGIVAFTKYRIAKLDWANARSIAELAKEAAAR